MTISKKELLEMTGISYGQLYRWKREGLIPEDWFIKKSTKTGQETFFPKNKIIERINTIQYLKDQYSMEEVGKILSPDNQKEVVIDISYLKQMNEYDKDIVDYYMAHATKELTYFDFILILACCEIKKRLHFNREEILAFMETQLGRLKRCGNTHYVILLFSYKHEYFMVLVKESIMMEVTKEEYALSFDENMKLVCEISLSELNDMFRKNNRNLFMGGV